MENTEAEKGHGKFGEQSVREAESRGSETWGRVWLEGMLRHSEEEPSPPSTILDSFEIQRY